MQLEDRGRGDDLERFIRTPDASPTSKILKVDEFISKRVKIELNSKRTTEY